MAINDILPSKLGFGAAPLGNMFRDIPEAEAQATVDAAWNDGIRYFDTAPFYGAGLAESLILTGCTICAVTTTTLPIPSR